MDAADDWMDADSEEGDDVCHHGIGFDVDCEWCEMEMDRENQ